MRLGVVGMLPRTLNPATDQSVENKTLGLAGTNIVHMLPDDFRTFSTEQFTPLLDTGFSGFGHHFAGNPEEVTEEVCERARSVWETLGLELAQFVLLYRECLFDPDASVRERIIRKIRAGNRTARWLKAGVHLIRPGSLNPAGSWTPHPENHTPASVSRFVDTLRRIAEDAEEEQVQVVVECHVVSIMRSPEVCLEVMERVGSPYVRLVMDPVNHFESIHQAFNSTEHLNHIFETLGSLSPIAHAKDIKVGNDLVTHLDEAVPGEGVMDYRTYLRKFQEYHPDGYMIIEHIPPDTVPQAAAFIRRIAGEEGVDIG